MLAILLTNNYDVMSRVRDEGELMVTAHTIVFFQQIMGKGDEMFAETGDNMIKRKRVLAWTLKEKTGNHNQKCLAKCKNIYMHIHTHI